METKTNWNKILTYLFIAFFVSWSIALLLYVFKLDINNLTTTILIAIFYMFGPAISCVITQKYIYKQSLNELGFSLDKTKIGWYLKIPLIFILFLLFIFCIIFFMGNVLGFSYFGKINLSQENFDINLFNLINQKIQISHNKLPVLNSKIMLFVFILQGVFAGFTLNIPVMLGEELGWRGFLLNETRNLGFLKSSLFIGTAWGLWHLPLILLGLNYPNHPYLGIITMCLFTISICPIFSYIKIKTNSILGPCIIHGIINGSGTILIFYVKDGDELFNSIAGFSGIFAALILNILIYYFDKKFLLIFKVNNTI